MRVVAWIDEGTWPACIQAVQDHVSAAADVTLLHVVDDQLAATVGGAAAGLLGRGGWAGDPEGRLRELADGWATQLLTTAVQRLGRPASVERRHGRVEREVVAALSGADLLVLARDGDLTRIGPHSLRPATRFVVDHAPCAILLVWPEGAPRSDALPPPPPGSSHHGAAPHDRARQDHPPQDHPPQDHPPR